MDNEKTNQKSKAKKTAVILIPIILAVIATVSVALTMGGSKTHTPEPEYVGQESPTPDDLPVDAQPETEHERFSDTLAFSISSEGKATVVGLGSCKDNVVRIPETTADGIPVTAIGESAFAYATGIDRVVLPSSIVSIGDYAFRGSSITSASIGAGVVSIGKGAFADCARLTAISVDGENPVYASRSGVLFDRDMKTLLCYPSGRPDISYTIPKSVTRIGHMAFYSCTSLKTLRYDGSRAQWSAVQIESGNTLLDTLTVLVATVDK